MRGYLAGRTLVIEQANELRPSPKSRNRPSCEVHTRIPFLRGLCVRTVYCRVGLTGLAGVLFETVEQCPNQEMATGMIVSEPQVRGGNRHGLYCDEVYGETRSE